MAKHVVTGSVLKRGDGASPEVFTTVPQVAGISGIGGGTAREIDVTDLASTAKEFLQGLPDNGVISMPIIWDPQDAQHQGLETDRANQTLRNWEIDFSDSPVTTASFAATVQSFPRSGEPDDVWRGDLNLRVSGGITFA